MYEGRIGPRVRSADITYRILTDHEPTDVHTVTHHIDCFKVRPREDLKTLKKVLRIILGIADDIKEEFTREGDRKASLILRT
ncbi:Hypothetical predicted protein [Pelobates cultripes]|uniref:Uncharacterized protein n=1 Tax=Pelobates cultripes TaxID=61616 RepID=A0AAD1T1Q2_PELCU|nr:Hypothetical predicted protein [Pelobates cultripes]